MPDTRRRKLLMAQSTDYTARWRAISHWTLEEASGTRNDSHGTNHLTDNNTVTQAAGIIGNAAQFATGNSEYLSIANNASLKPATGLSVSVWYKTSTADKGIIDKWNGNGYRMYHPGSGRVTVQVNNSTVTDSVTTCDGAWHHTVLTHDGTTLRLYRDGVERGTPAAEPLAHSTTLLTLGSLSAPTDYFNGVIDEVSLFGKALALADVQRLYNSGAGLAYPWA